MEREFESYKLNILGISEVRWPGQGKVPLGDKTLLYSGHETEHARGVGLVLDKEASKALLWWKGVSDRIIACRLQGQHAQAIVIQVYAPTEVADTNEKDMFYDELQSHKFAQPTVDLPVVTD